MSSSFTYIDTGVNNGASVIASFKRLGVEISCARSPRTIEQSSGVILPGVGTFEAGMRSLEEQEFVRPLRERVELGKPTLLICLGLQLLFSQSDESPGVHGLGIIQGSVRRLAPPATVPHFGWNEVRGASCGNGDAYFAHSYSVQDSPTGWERGVTDCGVRFTSFLKRNAVVATQFHPELSGAFGARIIQDWMENATCKKESYPGLDCKDNVVVKGVSFQNLTEVGDPVALSIRYEAQGADEIVILDVSATREERTHRLETIRAVREALSIPMTVGGGVRSVEDIASFLKAGADKVAINSAAVAHPYLVSEAVKLFGSQCIVVSIDCSRNGSSWSVRTRAGTRTEEITALTWAREVADRGAGEILLTSFDNDGRLCGYDCTLIESIAAAVPLPVIASGGARTAEHMYLAFEAGAAAVLAASLFHIDGVSIATVKKELKERGVTVRL